MANIPGKTTRRFYENKWVVEVVAMLPPIVAAVYAAFVAAASAITAPYAPVLWVGIVWLLMANVIRVIHAYKQDVDAKTRDEHDGLSAALHVLRAAVAGKHALDDENNGSLRVTIHRVVPPLSTPGAYEQLLPYIGGSGGAAYRKFPIGTGIVGMVARLKAVFVHSRESEDYEKYLRELVRDWGFTEAEASNVKKEIRSSMAVPIFSPSGVVEAVVYLDSHMKDLFTAETKAIVINCCKGIAAHIRERYK